MDNSGGLHKKFYVVFDLYNRIKYNLASIHCLSKFDWTTISMNILYRSIVTDMMYILFYLWNDNSEVEYIIAIDNYKHAQSAKIFLQQHSKLTKYIFPECEQIEQELTDRYRKYFSDIIISEKGKNWKFKKPQKPSSNSNYKGNIQDVADFLEKEPAIEEFAPYLYMLYRELSQSEHYSVRGSKFSFDNSSSFDRIFQLELHSLLYISNLYVMERLKTLL